MRATSPLLRTARGWVLLAPALWFGSQPILAAEGDAAAVSQTVASLKQAMNATLDLDACDPPERKKEVPEGHWKGNYRLICELYTPGKPVTMTMKWQGDLDFDVGRSHPAPPPPPPAHELRKPLRPPKSTSPLPDSVASAEKTAETEIDQAVTPPPARDSYTLYVPPGENGKIAGTATYVNDTSITGMIRGNSFKEPIHQASTVQFDVLAEEESDQFTELWLWGKPSQTTTAASMSASGPDNQMKGQMKFDGRGNGTYDVTVEHEGRRGEKSGTLINQPPAPAEQRNKLIRLKVESTDCSEIRGTVDDQQLKQQFASQGFNVVTKESEWVAVLDERDVDFEKRVQALVAEPLPGEMTWEYMERFDHQVSAMRQEGKRTDYRLCVLRDLDRKWIRISLIGIQTLVNDFPKVRDMNACAAITVMGASISRLVGMGSRLEYAGVNCPLTEKWHEAAENELRELAKQVMARKHSFEELGCLRGVRMKGFDFGESTDPFDKEFDAELTARVAKGGITLDR